MNTNISEFPTYAIVVRDNPVSEYYYSKITPLWESIGFKINRFDATTPTTLPDGPLRFGKNMLEKYLKVTNGQGKTMTPTECAIWYSHYRLWMKCVELNQPIVVIEHDCVPFDPSKLVWKHHTNFHRYDMGALGCYLIEPDFALHVLAYLDRTVITSGPLGTLCQFWESEKKNGVLWHVVDPATIADDYDAACTQILDTNYNTTVEHYENCEVEGKLNRPWPYYVVINDVDEPLTVDVIKKHRVPFRHGNH